ncbi:MAG: CrcB family protein [Ancrocorticia sp.]
MGSLMNSSTTTPSASKAASDRWQLPKFALLVALGATFGTFLRAALSGAFPHNADAWPWATFLINMVGSFVLGLLLESLVLTGTDSGWRRTVRLMCGTGIMGGFTTYSTFVLEIEKMAGAGDLALGFAYAAVSLVLGIAAAMLGMAVAGVLFGQRSLQGRGSGGGSRGGGLRRTQPGNSTAGSRATSNQTKEAGK